MRKEREGGRGGGRRARRENGGGKEVELRSVMSCKPESNVPPPSPSSERPAPRGARQWCKLPAAKSLFASMAKRQRQSPTPLAHRGTKPSTRPRPPSSRGCQLVPIPSHRKNNFEERTKRTSSPLTPPAASSSRASRRSA
jgi:hypothetical protein